MANGITTAFWGMTINNFNESELILVQEGLPDVMREIVHTIEVGKEGTPHIQAYIKLQRQQRMSFLKRYFPRASFKPLCSDDYIANTKRYAQKLDGTAVSPAVHRFNDPMYTVNSVMKQVLEGVVAEMNSATTRYPDISMDYVVDKVRRAMVAKDYRYAKIFVSSTFKQMWREYSEEMLEYYVAHTHTHTQEESAEQVVSVPTINAEASDENHRTEDYQSEERSTPDSDGDEESACDSDEGDDESECSFDCTTDVSEEY